MRCEPAFVRERARNLRGSRAARWGRRAARTMASCASALGTHTSGDVQSLHATRGCAPSALCARRSRDFFPDLGVRFCEGNRSLGHKGRNGRWAFTSCAFGPSRSTRELSFFNKIFFLFRKLLYFFWPKKVNSLFSIGKQR